MTKRRRLWIFIFAPFAMLIASLLGRGNQLTSPYANFLAPDVHAAICNAECVGYSSGPDQCVYSPGSGAYCYTDPTTGTCWDDGGDNQDCS